MISLRKTVTELDRLEEFHRTALHCYSEALRSTEQHAIELDAAQAASFRAQLQLLRGQLQDIDAGQLEAVQTCFEVELKAYAEKTRQQIQKLRQDFQAAAAAVESFAYSINESEANLESDLKRELIGLNQSAESNDIEKMRRAIHSSTSKIAADVEQLRSSNQLVIAQLKDEIRILHQEVQERRRAQTPDPSLETHQLIAGHMQELIRKNTPFSVLLVVVRNLEGLQNCYSAGVLDSGLLHFQTRFENLLPSSASVARWARNQFAAILTGRTGISNPPSSEIVRRLSEPFLEREGEKNHSIVFNPQAGMIEFSTGSNWTKFQGKLKQLADALAA